MIFLNTKNIILNNKRKIRFVLLAPLKLRSLEIQRIYIVID